MHAHLNCHTKRTCRTPTLKIFCDWRLLETPSPSGYEQPIQKIVREYAAGFADQIRTDLHGNVIAARNPDAKLRVMLAGHCDQIGFLVQYIDAEGFLYVQTIGGWDPWCWSGKSSWSGARRTEGIPAVVGRKAIHLLTDEERAGAQAQGYVDYRGQGQGRSRGAGAVGDPVTLAQQA